MGTLEVNISSLERGIYLFSEGGREEEEIGQHSVMYRTHVALCCGCSIPMAE